MVILMRKYYTLVQSGRQEGDGAGNVSAWKTNLCIGTNVVTVRNTRGFHILLFSILKKMKVIPISCFRPLELLLPTRPAASPSAPLLAPTIATTDVHVWMFCYTLSLHQTLTYPRIPLIDGLVKSHTNT